MAGGGVGEAMLIGAAMGAGTGAVTSAIDKKDPLQGALMGAVGGAAMGGIGAGMSTAFKPEQMRLVRRLPRLHKRAAHRNGCKQGKAPVLRLA